MPAANEEVQVQRAPGPFTRLVSRAAALLGSKPAHSSPQARRAGAPAKQEPPSEWSRALDECEELVRGHGADKSEQARLAWAALAGGELEELRAELGRLARSGKGDPSMIMRGVLSANKSGYVHGGLEEAACMAGLGWEERPSMGKHGFSEEALPSRWRASQLEDWGGGEPERLAELFRAARAGRRLSQMRRGAWDALQGMDGSDAARTSIRYGFAGWEGIWSPMADPFQHRAAKPAGMVYEPSLRALCDLFGAEPIRALASLGSPLAAEAIDAMQDRWQVRSGGSYGRPEAKVWKLPAPGAKVGLGEMEALLECGVPAWALGAEPAPASRWRSEPLEARLASGPEGMWGAFEEIRGPWLAAAKLRRAAISEESLCASYSDDSRLRQSEQADCDRQSAAVRAQEAAIDWMARASLPDGHPWRLDEEDHVRAAKAFEAVQGPLAQHRSGVPGFEAWAVQAGWSPSALLDPKAMAQGLAARAEALAIESSLGAPGDGRPASRARL